MSPGNAGASGAEGPQGNGPEHAQNIQGLAKEIQVQELKRLNEVDVTIPKK
jgi:hypothetical protein